MRKNVQLLVYRLFALLGVAVPTFADIEPAASRINHGHQSSGADRHMMTGIAGDELHAGRTCTGETYRTEVEAVQAASEAWNPLSIMEDREYMGAILQCGEHYYYTVAPGEVGADSITVRIAVPVGHRIAAFWHTHGAPADDRQYFSDVDTQLARSWQRPFYLADYTGALKVFRPGDKLMSRRKARRLGLPEKKGFASGRLVQDSRGQVVQVATRIKSKLLAGVGYTEDGIASNHFGLAPM